MEVSFSVKTLTVQHEKFSKTISHPTHSLSRRAHKSSLSLTSTGRQWTDETQPPLHGEPLGMPPGRAASVRHRQRLTLIDHARIGCLLRCVTRSGAHACARRLEARCPMVRRRSERNWRRPSMRAERTPCRERRSCSGPGPDLCWTRSLASERYGS
jgi:hypothetical protein